MLLIIESIDFCYEKNSFLAFRFLLYLYLAIYSIQVRLNIWNASQICVPCLCKDHANLLCIIPILVYVLLKQAQEKNFLMYNSEVACCFRLYFLLKQAFTNYFDFRKIKGFQEKYLQVH